MLVARRVLFQVQPGVAKKNIIKSHKIFPLHGVSTRIQYTSVYTPTTLATWLNTRLVTKNDFQKLILPKTNSQNIAPENRPKIHPPKGSPRKSSHHQVSGATNDVSFWETKWLMMPY